MKASKEADQAIALGLRDTDGLRVFGSVKEDKMKVKRFVTEYSNYVMDVCMKADDTKAAQKVSRIHYFVDHSMITISEAMRTLAEIHAEAEEKMR